MDRCVLLTPFSYSVAYLLVNCYLLLLYCIVTENQKVKVIRCIMIGFTLEEKQFLHIRRLV